MAGEKEREGDEGWNLRFGWGFELRIGGSGRFFHETDVLRSFDGWLMKHDDNGEPEDGGL